MRQGPGIGSYLTLSRASGTYFFLAAFLAAFLATFFTAFLVAFFIDHFS